MTYICTCTIQQKLFQKLSPSQKLHSKMMFKLYFSQLVEYFLNNNFYLSACNIVAYVFLFVIFGAIYLFVRCLFDRRRRHGHAKAGKFEDQRVPMSILFFHLVVTLLALLLTLLTTSGYIMACENLQDQVR